MADESFLLVSLKDEQAKQLAQVVNNDTCRNILDELSKGKATETELSKRLNVPLSTVHYNLKALMKFNLIRVDEFHYSEKGKEVNHYSLANKFIIIAPKDAKIESFKDKLKKILPVGIVSVAGAGIIRMLGLINQPSLAMDAAAKAAPRLMAEESEMLAAPASQMVAEAVPQAINAAAQPYPWATVAMWFLIGAAFAVAVYLLVEFIRMKRRK